MTEPQVRQQRLAEHYRAASAEQRLHATAELVATSLDFPIALINVLDDQRLYSIGAYGIEADEAPRDESMCQFVVRDGCVVVTNNPQQDDRYRELGSVRNGLVGTYLGVPIESRESTPIGTVCVIDTEHREVDSDVVSRLQGFATLIESRLDLLRRELERGLSGRPDSQALATALRRREIVPWYQPVVDLATGRHHAVEALARWEQPDRCGQPVVPNVQRAEDSDLIIDLDRAVMRQAVADFALWQARGSDLRLNLNLSTRHLELPDTARVVRDVVAAAGVDATSVTLEITETRELADLQRASVAVADLRRAGFAVALDDFGKGWSSLDWLLSLHVDGIKVDGLIAQSLDRRVGVATCRALVGIAEDMALTTTLEGIGTQWQRERAVAAGFCYGQGFLWSPAVPAAMIEALL